MCFCTHPWKVGEISSSCTFSFLCQRPVTHTSWSHYTSNIKEYELLVHKEYGKTCQASQILLPWPSFPPRSSLKSGFRNCTILVDAGGLGTIFLPPFLHYQWQEQSFVLAQFGFECEGNALQKGECILLAVWRLYLEVVRKQSLQLFIGEGHCQYSLRHGTIHLYLGSRLTSPRSESSVAQDFQEHLDRSHGLQTLATVLKLSDCQEMKEQLMILTSEPAPLCLVVLTDEICSVMPRFLSCYPVCPASLPFHFPSHLSF